MPATSAAFAGSAAFVSVEVIPTVWVEETGFQFASTALTVTENGVPAVRADGVPVLPGRAARRGGLAREEELELAERARVDGDRG